MSERYYVVTESELARLKKAAVNEALANSDRWSSEDKELQEAETACRTRFVKWYEAQPGYVLWLEET